MPRAREEVFAELSQLTEQDIQARLAVRACPCSVAVCAHSNRSDGHASAGAETVPKLTLQLDHSMGAAHRRGAGSQRSTQRPERRNGSMPLRSP
jgi:hypothetical protein